MSGTSNPGNPRGAGRFDTRQGGEDSSSLSYDGSGIARAGADGDIAFPIRTEEALPIARVMLRPRGQRGMAIVGDEGARAEIACMFVRLRKLAWQGWRDERQHGGILLEGCLVSPLRRRGSSLARPAKTACISEG